MSVELANCWPALSTRQRAVTPFQLQIPRVIDEDLDPRTAARQGLHAHIGAISKPHLHDG